MENKDKFESFDFNYFKNYVNTYNPNLENPKSIILDMVYGIGISVNQTDDEKPYSFHSGFKKFSRELVILLVKKFFRSQNK